MGAGVSTCETLGGEKFKELEECHLPKPSCRECDENGAYQACTAQLYDLTRRPQDPDSQLPGASPESQVFPDESAEFAPRMPMLPHAHSSKPPAAKAKAVAKAKALVVAAPARIVAAPAFMQVQPEAETGAAGPTTVAPVPATASAVTAGTGGSEATADAAQPGEPANQPEAAAAMAGEEQPPLLRQSIAALQGNWLNSSSLRPAAMIYGTRIHWRASCKHEPTSFSLDEKGQLTMDLKNGRCNGVWSPGPPREIKWSDGTAWRLDRDAVDAASFDDLTGQWIQQAEGKPIAKIEKGSVEWDDRFSGQPVDLKPCPVCPGGQVAGYFEDKEICATFAAGPPATLSWEDGDVWVRTDIVTNASS
eukprot:TRINITY_DN15344_c0_g1_i1.p1 TRINITY_DN15344_c0_g1~~TRINITY_DN15344_c0_g1_i1.p1  ORF type:complete len:363 (-),score=73.57 TRINITY_DN15344_c0_g1_i1:130-1218(-)